MKQTPVANCSGFAPMDIMCIERCKISDHVDVQAEVCKVQNLKILGRESGKDLSFPSNEIKLIKCCL